MRVSSALLLGLPVLTAAQSPLDEYKAKFQNFLSSFGVAQAVPEAAPDAAEVKATSTGKTAMHVLDLHTWNQTLFAPVKQGATKPEEWWVLITGGNKTCFGHCLQVEAAYNETAVKFAGRHNTPHMALVNCDDQPVLCNSWSAGPPGLWVFEMLPRPAPINIYGRRLNMTSTTTKTFLDFHAQADRRQDFGLYESYFHPYDGVLTQYGAAVPIGYILHFFSVVPSWAMMLGISFLSRSMM
jgi:hypothetical protein